MGTFSCLLLTVRNYHIPMKLMTALVPFVALFLFSGVDGCEPKSGMVYQVVVGGGISNPRKYLSTPSNGLKTDLWYTDDGSGRQKWEFTKHGDYWNIQVRDGVSQRREYLSTTSDGSKVDIYWYDDGSGRQRWNIFPAYGGGSWCNIRIQDGVNGGRVYLSTTSNGEKVDLWHNDDNSGRQKWKLVELGPINSPSTRIRDGSNPGSSANGLNANTDEKDPVPNFVLWICVSIAVLCCIIGVYRFTGCRCLDLKQKKYAPVGPNGVDDIELKAKDEFVDGVPETVTLNVIPDASENDVLSVQ